MSADKVHRDLKVHASDAIGVADDVKQVFRYVDAAATARGAGAASVNGIVVRASGTVSAKATLTATAIVRDDPARQGGGGRWNSALWNRATWSDTPKTTPPRRAILLLDCLLAPKLADAVIGDLNERYPAKLGQHGPFGARLWFWSQAVRSLVPLGRWVRWAAFFELVRRWHRT